MSGATPTPHPVLAKEDEVWRQIGQVTDPELDESVTEMGFVTGVEIRNDDEVFVSFRLPTYWCAANFAFMMGDDMRRAVLALEWVRKATVSLSEHMYVDAINRGVNEGLSFRDAFGAEASGDLDELRQTFLRKAFEWRQEALLTHLLKTGAAAEEVVQLTSLELARTATDPESQGLVRRYLDRRHIAGAAGPSDPAFVTIEGAPLAAEGLADYLRAIRRVRANAEFNGALCRGLLVERFGVGPQSQDGALSARPARETALNEPAPAAPCQR